MSELFSKYKTSIEFFKSILYENNEYFIKGDVIGSSMNKLPINGANTFFIENLIINQIDLGNNRGRTIIKKEAIERFHPNKINNKDFWLVCKENFPLASCCSVYCKNINDVNQINTKLINDVGLLPFLISLFNKSKDELNLLEIGFGYGNLFFEIKDKCNYYGIDYVIDKSLKKYKNFIEIDETGIPDYLLDINLFDVVYSVNTLQHCSQKDRFKYFQQGYNALKRGGYLMFTENLMTNKNKNDICWGVIDENGRGYTQFFNQLTECDWNYELFNKLDNIGFKPIRCNIISNLFIGIIQK